MSLILSILSLSTSRTNSQFSCCIYPPAMAKVLSIAQTDVGPLDTLIVNCEQGQAKELLLIDLLGRLHGLLIIHNSVCLERDYGDSLDLPFCGQGRISLFEPCH